MEKIVSFAANALNQRQGEAFASRIDILLEYNGNTSFIDGFKRGNIANLCSSKISDSNLASLVHTHLESIVLYLSNDFKRSYKTILTCYNHGLDYFSSSDEETFWFLPILIKLSLFVKKVAMHSDQSANDSEFTNLRDSLQSLTRGWTILAKDRTAITNPASKKRALFAMTNILFKIYFTLNTLALCGKLINVVEGPSSGGVMQNLELFPLSDVVMYKYYHGRLKMFEDKYEEARDSLRFALKYTPSNQKCFQNRQRILTSLIPIEMCLGVMPTEVISSAYGLDSLYQLGQCVIKGDIKTFDTIVLTHQKSFIKIGIYLVVEQLKSTVYRSLFKRIYRIINSTRLNLVTVETALHWLGEQEMSLDEIECIVSNLIFAGKVKGYISHQKRYLVLSKTDPFPTSTIVKSFVETN